MGRHRTALGTAGLPVLLTGCATPDAVEAERATSAGLAGAASSSDREERLREAVSELQEETGIGGGVVVTDGSTGETVAVDADFPVRAASTSKVAVVMAWLTAQ